MSKEIQDTKAVGEVIYFKMSSNPIEHIHKAQIKYRSEDYQGTYYIALRYVGYSDDDLDRRDLIDTKVYKSQCVDDEVGKLKYDATQALYEQEREVVKAQKEYERLKRVLDDIGKEPKFNCLACYHFGTDGTCDMCATGHPIATDNNGLKPDEVVKCDVYSKQLL